jgi:hypothetical protein
MVTGWCGVHNCGFIPHFLGDAKYHRTMRTEKLESDKWIEHKNYTPDNSHLSFGFHFIHNCIDYYNGKLYSIGLWYGNLSTKEGRNERGTEMVLVLDLKGEHDWTRVWLDSGHADSPQIEGFADMNCVIYRNYDKGLRIFTDSSSCFDFGLHHWPCEAMNDARYHRLYRFRGEPTGFDFPREE